jgi:hypothetical protein
MATTQTTASNFSVRIIPTDCGNPAGKPANAELHFADGPLARLKLVGFAIWERRARRTDRVGNPISGERGGRNVTFPARQYAVNGERRSFALLRPISDASAQDRIRDLVLAAFGEWESSEQR